MTLNEILTYEAAFNFRELCLCSLSMRMHLLRWFLSALAFLTTAFVIPGFEVSGLISALIAAIVVGVANAFIWPILMFLTLPINILTLGLFTFVVNGIVIKMCAAIVPGFKVNSWMAAILGSVVLYIFNYVFQTFVIGHV